MIIKEEKYPDDILFYSTLYILSLVKILIYFVPFVYIDYDASFRLYNYNGCNYSYICICTEVIYHSNSDNNY